MEALSPLRAPNEIWLTTYREDQLSYQRWHRSDLYCESHAGIPKGLKLVPSAKQLRFLILCSVR